MIPHKKLSVFSILFLITIVAASTQSVKIKIEHVLTIGQDDEGIIFQWVGLTTDNKGNIYITDLQDYSIKKFDKKGNFVKKTGRKGQGPGEFITPGIIRFKDGNLFVGQIQHTGIQVFDADLNYIKSIPLEVIPSSFRIVGENKISISQLGSNEIQFYDFKGKKIGSFQYIKDKSFMINTVDFVNKGENYYLCFKWKNIISKHSNSGRKIWEHSIFKMDKIQTKKIGGFNLPQKVCFKTICFDNRDYLYVLGGHLSKNINRDIYVFSQDGKWIETITLPEQTHMIHIDENNFLYSRSESGTIVKKFKLIYND